LNVGHNPISLQLILDIWSIRKNWVEMVPRTSSHKVAMNSILLTHGIFFS